MSLFLVLDKDSVELKVLALEWILKQSKPLGAAENSHHGHVSLPFQATSNKTMGHLMCLFLRCVQISRSRMKGQHAAGLALLILSSCAIQGYSLPQNRWILSSWVKQRFFNNCAGIQQRSMQGSLVLLQQRKTLPMTLTTRSRLPRRRGACSTLSWKLP